MMESVNPMEARQRRMELRRQSASKKRCLDYDDSIDHNDDDDDDDSSFSTSSSSSKGNSATSSFTIQDSKMKNKKHKGLEAISSNSDVDLSMYRGIKKQARYEPTIPISSKAELAAWRKDGVYAIVNPPPHHETRHESVSMSWKVNYRPCRTNTVPRCNVL